MHYRVEVALIALAVALFTIFIVWQVGFLRHLLTNPYLGTLSA